MIKTLCLANPVIQNFVLALPFRSTCEHVCSRNPSNFKEGWQQVTASRPDHFYYYADTKMANFYSGPLRTEPDNNDLSSEKYVEV